MLTLDLENMLEEFFQKRSINFSQRRYAPQIKWVADGKNRTSHSLDKKKNRLKNYGRSEYLEKLLDGLSTGDLSSTEEKLMCAGVPLFYRESDFCSNIGLRYRLCYSKSDLKIEDLDMGKVQELVYDSENFCIIDLYPKGWKELDGPLSMVIGNDSEYISDFEEGISQFDMFSDFDKTDGMIFLIGSVTAFDEQGDFKDVIRRSDIKEIEKRLNAFYDFQQESKLVGGFYK